MATTTGFRPVVSSSTIFGSLHQYSTSLSFTGHLPIGYEIPSPHWQDTIMKIADHNGNIVEYLKPLDGVTFSSSPHTKRAGYYLRGERDKDDGITIRRL
jgi:hypothetical protein